MHISVSTAKGQLTALVRRAEAGEEVVLTRHGRAVVRLSPANPETVRERRRRVIDDIIAEARANPIPGESAARSQDFLYGEDGLPK